MIFTPTANPARDPPPEASRPPVGRSGIARRVALLAWFITLTTLLVFVAALIPEQKRIFQQNLESKARGIAVSLEEVAAGGVVSEDYSSVVDHCLQLLKGDPAISHLVIIRNDGFSLLADRSGWRTENLGIDWRPATRTSRAALGANALFPVRSFQYAKPFDYSGIQWGWIHVGLSLETYDRSLRNLYVRTGLVALVCAAFSLGVSLIYARKLTRPIRTLRSTVQRVADGDLAARAPTDRTDELGSLAHSFNTMAEALLRRDHILASVQFAARQFLSTPDWRTVIEAVLARLGEATAVSRILIFESRTAGEGRVEVVARFEWVAPGLGSVMANSEWAHRTYESPASQPWTDALSRGEVVAALARDLPPGELKSLCRPDVRSLLVVPIMIESTCWGCLSLDDCHTERAWTGAERDSLHVAADMLGAAIARQRTQDALLEAKATLELRVDERTKELREQMAAKEQVLADLADAQQRLVDASRMAGMAEVATGVLHNVGNVLNSVNVSANLVRERLAGSRVAMLVRTADLMRAQGAALAAFLCDDPRGRHVPELVIEVAGQLAAEHQALAAEAGELSRNVEHIKGIVAVQQSYARTAGVIELLPPGELFEDALRMNQSALLRHQVVVTRDFAELPRIGLDRHKILQILVNLVANAIHSVTSPRVTHRKIHLRLQADATHLRFAVEDTGVGIAPTDLVRIFSHGFTTRKDGHGFGLHSGAITARALGGSLQVRSEGLGHGACFILELPRPSTASPDRPASVPLPHAN